MRLKVRPSDFKVTERLADDVVQRQGAHRVYRVQKEKVTSMEAATELASTLGIVPGDISMAGLKDRQGVTVQHMSVHRGPTVRIDQPGLRIQDCGFSAEAITADQSLGNDFEIVVRDLGREELDHARRALDEVREHGLPNYFDAQRFGNLRHGQGWIVLDLVRGDIGGALRRLVASASPYEPPARRRLKDALWRAWGDWAAARQIAGKLGRHHSLFEHLKRDPEDFEGAFHRVSTRERLIHLYAFQSHLFNRALSVAVKTSGATGFTVDGVEGPLRFPRGACELPQAWGGSLVMPGEALDGVEDEAQRELYAGVLERLGLRPDELRLPDIAGFQLKPEARDAMVAPEGRRVRPAEDDNLYRGRKMLRMRFSLPRGAYATLVVQRLLGPTARPHGGSEGAPADGPRPTGPRRVGGRRRGGARGGPGRRSGGRGRGGGGRGGPRGRGGGRGRGRGGPRR